MAGKKGSTKSNKTSLQKPVKKGITKMARKSAKTSNKSARKLPGFFNLANRKFVILLIVFVAAAGFGTWKLYSTQAAGAGKYEPVVACVNRSPRPKLQWGMTDEKTGEPCIKTLQGFLNASGTGGRQLSIDGDFYDQTKAAVIHFQNNKNFFVGANLKVDGIVGDQTWEQIRIHCHTAQFYVNNKPLADICHTPRNR